MIASEPGRPPFQLLTIGPFDRAAVRCSLTSEVPARSAEIDELIDAAWQARTKEASTRGQLLFNGPLCRMLDWEVVGGVLTIRFGRTDYRALVGTNIAHPTVPAAFRSDGCGVCSTIETSDGFLLVQRRSDRVFEHPGRFHVVGGSLEPRDDSHGPHADPFRVMEREIEEELGAGRDQIAAMSCLGLARDGFTLKPEILLKTRLTIPMAELAGATSDEHAELIWIRADSASINGWLATHWERVAPAGLACLVAHVACDFAAGLAASWTTPRQGRST